MSTKIQESYVIQAQNLVNQDRLVEAWQVLSNGGDTYAASAADLLDSNGNFLGYVVQNYWDIVYGVGVRDQKWNSVAKSHLQNYITSLNDQFFDSSDNNEIATLPNTNDIENSYARALQDNGLSKNGAIDLAINQATQPVTISLELFVSNYTPWIDTTGMDLTLDMPDWAALLGAMYGDFEDRYIPNSDNFTDDSAQLAVFNLAMAGLIAGIEYVRDPVNNVPTPVTDAVADMSIDILYAAARAANISTDRLADLVNTFYQLKADFDIIWDNSTITTGNSIQDITSWMQDIISRTISARTEASPLVFDLDGDGVELLNIDNGVYWDIDGDDFAEQSGWVGADDGLLAIDKNDDGLITEHSELFGSETIDGFTYLSLLDSDDNDVINANDAQFNDLLIWQDVNGDGISQASELQSLSAWGITSISLNDTSASYQIAGNNITHESTFTMNGQTRDVVDAWFTYDNTNTRFVGDVTLDIRTAFLPTARGYGGMPDLHIAMSMDEDLLLDVQDIATKTLGELFDPAYDLQNKVKDIMYRWAGVDGDDITGRGQYIDGRDLAFLEVLSDIPFAQHGRQNPLFEASSTLNNAFNDFYNQFLAKILFQTSGQSLFSNASGYSPVTDVFNGMYSLDFVKIENFVLSLNQSGNDLRESWEVIVRVIDTIIETDNLSTNDKTTLENLISSTSSNILTLDAVLEDIYGSVRLSLNGTSGNDTLIGGEGHDTLGTGYGDDILYGRGGNDRLSGDFGNDTLRGEDGDDLLQGGVGNDIYVYDSGLDTIIETSGIDKVEFISSIQASDITIKEIPYNLDLEIYNKGNLAIVIQDFFASTDNQIETIEFQNGDASIDLSNLYTTTYGTAGNDILIYDPNNPYLTDRFGGLEGDDVLNGGTGNDFLVGGVGNDTYIVEEGHDSIFEEGGSSDTIQFGVNDLSENMTLAYSLDGKDLNIYFNGALRTTIVGQYNTVQNQVETAILGDGTSINLLTINPTYYGSDQSDDLIIPSLLYKDNMTINALAGDDIVKTGNLNDIVYGGDGDDTITTTHGDDIIHGEKGNDNLQGDLGDDVLTGGEGVDILSGGDGNDIYNWSVGDGNDQFFDTNGIDEIHIHGGVTADDVKFDYKSYSWPQSGQYLSVKIGNEELELPSHISFDNNNNRVTERIIETLRFDDGTSIDLTAPLIFEGTDQNDEFYGVLLDEEYHGGDGDDIIRGNQGDDVLYGDNGDDTIQGGSHDDTLIGGAGNDNLQGDYGDDVLTGGEGVDILSGGYGNDVYHWSVGDGNDQFFDTNGIDEIHIHGGVTADDVKFDYKSYSWPQSGQYLSIQIGGEELQLPGHVSFGLNHAYDPSRVIETLRFDGGTSIDLTAPLVYEGTDQNDDFSGTLLDEEYHGGDGDDIIRGNQGDDVLYGDNGDDTIQGGSHDDTLIGGAGNDNLQGDYGDDVLTGGEGVDILSGGYGNDVYHWSVGDGNDQFFDTNGVDTLYIHGDVQLSNLSLKSVYDSSNRYNLLININDETVNIGRHFSFSNNALQADRMLESIVLDNGENIDIGVGNVFAGNSFHNVLQGNSGNNFLFGNEGNDTYVLDQGYDYVSDTSGSSDKVLVGGSYILSDMNFYRTDGGNNLVITPDFVNAIIVYDHFSDPNAQVETLEFSDGSTFDLTTLNLDIEGTTSNDTLYGFLNTEVGDDIINGYAGDDIAFARGGNDIIYGGSGSDELYGENGDDEIHGGDDNDYKLYGGNGNDTIYGDAGDDTLYGDAGHDVLHGGAGVDIIWAGEGNDTIHGGDGHDAKLDGGNGNDTIYGEAGNDTLYGRAGDDILYGGEGNDVLYAEAGNDHLYGENGDDLLYGYGGNDVLDGGLGFDRYYGNAGGDTFVFTDYSQYTSIYDIVYDFNAADGDILDISDLVSSYDATTESITDYIWTTHNSVRSYIYIDEDGTGTNASMEYAIRMDGVFWDDTDMATLITNGTVIV